MQNKKNKKTKYYIRLNKQINYVGRSLKVVLKIK